MSKVSRFFEVLKCRQPSVCRRVTPTLLKVISSFLKVILIVHETVFVNIVFRVQYVLTVIILLALSLVIAIWQVLWSSMNCQTDNSGYVMDICYTLPPYSSVDAFNVSIVNIPYPGVIKGPGSNRVYHYYYPWVSSVLFLQAVLFLIPWYFWRTIEVRRVQDVLKEFTEASVGKFHSFSDEITSSTQNWSYLAFFFVTDILNILNVIGQIFLMDSFLGGNFLTYGSDVIRNPRGTPQNPYDIMVRVFPRIAMCHYKDYGSSGDIYRHNTLCSLPLNVLYQKIYLFLWFYFIVLATMSCFALVYHFLLLLIPPLRRMLLMLLTKLDAKSAKSVTRNLNVGAWFYLYNLSKNLHSFSLRELSLFLSENFANEKSISIEMDHLLPFLP